MPLTSAAKYTKKYIHTIITPCTCGRKRHSDYTDLAVIVEQDGYGKDGRVCSSSLVVCLRIGCGGMWRGNRPYIEKLPRMCFSDYNK